MLLHCRNSRFEMLCNSLVKSTKEFRVSSTQAETAAREAETLRSENARLLEEATEQRSMVENLKDKQQQPLLMISCLS